MGVAELLSAGRGVSVWPRASLLPERNAEADQAALTALRRRMGDQHFGTRMRAQVDMMVQLSGLGLGGFHFENVPWIARAVGLVLRLSRTQARARRNALALTCGLRTMGIDNLPPILKGLRVLHLADLHLDAEPGFGKRVADALSGAEFDLCLISGDFRFLDAGRYQHLEVEIRALAPALGCRHGVYGVLGNHDFLEMVPMLEANGIRILMNEADAIRVGDQRLWVVGVDDPHLYGTHDFERAMRDVPRDDSARVLLVHSPEVVSEARELGFCAYFTGHTHGGQICLPDGSLLYVHARCAREFANGAWRVGSMAGYTSRGVGSSSVFARFNCPPEIIVHSLQPRLT